MAAEDQGTTAQAEETAQDQASNEEQNQQGQESNGNGTEEQQTFDADYVKRLREEAAGYRKRLRDLETAEKKRADAEKTQLERLNEENETYKSNLDRLTRQVRRAAFIEQIGLPNPRAAWAMAQDIGLDVEWTDDDSPANLDAIRKALRKEDPRLFGDGSADGGRRGPAPQDNDMNARIRSAFGR